MRLQPPQLPKCTPLLRCNNITLHATKCWSSCPALSLGCNFRTQGLFIPPRLHVSEAFVDLSVQQWASTSTWFLLLRYVNKCPVSFHSLARPLGTIYLICMQINTWRQPCQRFRCNYHEGFLTCNDLLWHNKLTIIRPSRGGQWWILGCFSN